MPESELFDIVDENGNPTGKTVIRHIAHEKGILHRTAHVWVIQRGGDRTDVLLQRRSAEKDSWPLCLDTSSAGHILAGDEPKESALRELEEELGIHASADDLHEAGTFRIQFQEVFHDRLFNDNEIAFLYVYEKPVAIEDLKLQKEEVSEAVWMEIGELAQRIENGDPEVCADIASVRLLNRYIQTESSDSLQAERKNNMADYSKRDWKLLRERLPGWQENYMARLLMEYREIMDSDQLASDRWWKLHDRLKEDKKKTGVLAHMAKSEMPYILVSLLNEGAISEADLEGFSDQMIEIIHRIRS